MSRFRFLFLITVIAVTFGCRPQRQAAVPVPTKAALPSVYQLEDAERVARDFLTNWQAGDFAAMYRDLSFASQEANPFDSFQALYMDAQDTMTFDSLDVQPNTILRERDEVAVFNYNVTFHTRRVGDFTDADRNLTLVVDDRAQDWRVAWTPDDLFPDMSSGARLQLSETIPNRANIYDSNGSVLADQNGRVVRVQIIRQQIPAYNDCLSALAVALDEPVADVQTVLEAHPANWLLDVGEIEPQTYTATHTALEQSCNASFKEQQTRRYPTAQVAAHILGYVGYPDEADIPAVEAAGFNQELILGRSGVELTWDSTLRGQPGGSLTLVTSAGSVVRELAHSQAQPGESLWLTLDASLQAKMQQIVADHYAAAKDSWAPGSKGASVVVMNPNTGEIYAMVGFPSYDDNAFNPYPVMGHAAGQQLIQQYSEDPRNPEIYRPTMGLYPLGSAMKTVTATAAADSGVYALNQSYVCTGSWNRDITRYDWYRQGHGRVTLAQALTVSCNPYFYEAGYQLDQSDPYILPHYMHLAGFGGPTGMTDLPEQQGFIPDPDWYRTTYGEDWRFSESVNMAIGQGEVQVTPLQVARWYSALANGGSLPTPYVVAKYGLIGEDLTPAHEPELTPLGIKPEVIETIRGGICAVTTSSVGTAEFVFRNSQLQTIGVCGKTGTAQTGSSDTNSHAWFAGYAPRENPQIVVVAMVETSGEGSEVAAPIVREVMETYFGMTN